MNRCPICKNIIENNNYKCDKCGLEFDIFNDADYKIREDGYLLNYYKEGKNVLLPDGIIGIGSYVFSKVKSLETLSMPDTLQSLDSNSLAASYFKHISFSQNLKFIGKEAFYNSDIEEVDIETNEDLLIQYSCFENCYNLKKVHIKAKSLKLETNILANCVNLEELALENAVDLGYNTFSRNIKKVYLGGTFSYLYRHIFDKMDNLKKIYLSCSKDYYLNQLHLDLDEFGKWNGKEIMFNSTIDDYLNNK